eukprot:INCI2508.2.p1 GENE.INCI2508.2~~INCI2508.2.p1  ORF type:complete len:465 (-),score=82.53 INCI2508.2:1182-2576(-)
MGVASSIPYASVEEALAAGVSQADIDAYLAAHKQESVPKLQVAPVPLSSRAEKVSHPAVSYLPLFLEAAGNMFVPESNPDGFIVLAVAENKLAWPNMADIFAEASSTFPPELAGYGPMDGTDRFKSALAAHMTRKFGGYKFDQNGMATAAGCGAIIDMLAFCLCEEGEAFMIPTPYYPGFDNDLRARANVNIVECPTEAPSFQVTASALEESLASAAAAGTKVKAILLTNPSNPLGTCMQREELQTVVDFASKNGLHVISDEIYAQSVYDDDAQFVSMSSLFEERGERMGDNVHIVYGFSKDFAASGLRAGILYSENEAIHVAFNTLVYFCSISNQTQNTLAALLEQDAALDTYFGRTTAGLRSQYRNLEKHLNSLNIRFIPSAAGLFTCIDLSPFLDEKTWEAEARLHKKLFDECKTLLTPGSDCHMPEPGWFRCCWAWVSEASVDEFATRLKAAFPTNTSNP